VGYLLGELDSYDGPIPLEKIVELLQRTNLFVQDMGSYGVFREDRYSRNLIREKPNYEVYCMCWRSGQRSTIHDHQGSLCAVRVLDGIMTNIDFEAVGPRQARPTRSHMYYPGAIDGRIESDIHQVANLQPTGEDLMTLHVYSPPLRHMNVYRQEQSEVA
jgi:cysteine dioxygenase